ncbi:hypothetical protein [Polluticoccus soli]|uniref:hypothetical protein n=1 Tax=Polluticoccus soli TaxID=3034150 RepID=UPI0023E34541|nr:hypothetical protein [Flavipsychrobacter sp. JY13-12]
MFRLLFSILCACLILPALAQQRTAGLISKKKSADTIIIIKKAAPIDTLSPEEKLFMEQTHSGTKITEEKGGAVFFGNGSKIKGTNLYYAFHNTAPKGTIIKVYNPGTEKTIYVKVLSVIPGTKQYHNSIIGISAGAKQELGVADEKTWCVLEYAP